MRLRIGEEDKGGLVKVGRLNFGKRHKGSAGAAAGNKLPATANAPCTCSEKRGFPRHVRFLAEVSVSVPLWYCLLCKRLSHATLSSFLLFTLSQPSPDFRSAQSCCTRCVARYVTRIIDAVIGEIWGGGEREAVSWPLFVARSGFCFYFIWDSGRNPKCSFNFTLFWWIDCGERDGGRWRLCSGHF